MTALLQLEDISKHYGSLRAVDGVTLEVRESERRALIGPNGAGKTTLFSTIAGETRPSGGRMAFGGTDITSMREDARARLGIGRTFQHSRLFDGLSASENLALAVQRPLGLARRMLRPARAYREVGEAVEELLAAGGLADRREALATSLSHGERRQLEIAMALASRPRLLLLDEPTAGMSQDESARFVETLKGLPAALTLVVVEHDMDVVFAIASRITVLNAGQVLADGTPEEIAASPAVQEAYLGTPAVEVGA